MNRAFVLSALLPAAAFAVSTYAGIDQAPPNFPYRDGDVVFVDFQHASYRLTYDFAAKTVNVESEIDFEAPARGYPVFDLIPEPRNVRIDDRDTEVGELADPDSASKFRVVRTLVSPGSHRMTLTHSIGTNVVFRANGVASGFWMSDLTDRRYLEQYLPTNFEFDQYAMSMRVEIVNAKGIPHVVRANGVVKTVSENVFEIEFPAYFTTSSLFFHLSAAGAIPSESFTVKSIDGRDLPVEVYTASDLKGYVDETKRVIAELENDYGPFPHPKVVVYGVPPGGMEYSGATVASSTALGHELFHSYNARGVMPAQGNAGWIDEAMSSWRDRHYALRKRPGRKTKMAGHSLWTRKTDTDAYTKGADFLEWIAGRMEATGKDFKAFLRDYFKSNMHRTMTTAGFEKAIETYSGFDLEADFLKYVYGKPGIGAEKRSTWPATAVGSCAPTGADDSESIVENPFHPKLTERQLLDLL